MPAAAASNCWRLQCSRSQRKADALLVIAVGMAVSYGLGVLPGLFTFIVLLTCWLISHWPGRQVDLIEPVAGDLDDWRKQRFSNAEKWRLQFANGNTLLVDWRKGSVRRQQMLLLRYGIWPWQALLIRTDSCENEQSFRRLVRRLYGHPALR